MIPSREVGNMAIKLKYLMKKKKTNKNGKCMLEIHIYRVILFFFGMSADVPAFEVPVLASKFELRVRVNRY